MPKHPKAIEAEQRRAELLARAQTPTEVPPPQPANATPAPAPAPEMHAGRIDLPANPVIPPESEVEILKRRLSTMDGVLKAQKRDMEALLEAERKRGDELAAQMNALQTKPLPPVKPEEVFAPETVEELGNESMIKMLAGIDKLLESKLEQHTAPLRQQLETYQRSEERRQQSTELERKQAFHLAIAQAVPGYETWALAPNTEPRFATWLNGRTPGSRLTRQQLLDDAAKHLDAVAVVEMLQEFQRTLGASPAAHPDARTLVTGSPPGDRPPPAGPKMTLDFVRQFRKDLTQGKYRGMRAREAADIHRRITEAFKRGEIAE